MVSSLVVLIFQPTPTPVVPAQPPGFIDQAAKWVAAVGGLAAIWVALRTIRSSRIGDEQKILEMQHKSLDMERLRRELGVETPEQNLIQRATLVSQVETQRSVIGIEGLVVRFILFYLVWTVWNFIANVVRTGLAVASVNVLSPIFYGGFDPVGVLVILGQFGIVVFFGLSLFKDINVIYGQKVAGSTEEPGNSDGEGAPPSLTQE